MVPDVHKDSFLIEVIVLTYDIAVSVFSHVESSEGGCESAMALCNHVGSVKAD